MKRLLGCMAAVLCVLGVVPAAAAASAASPWKLLNPVGPQEALTQDLRAVCALDGGTVWAAGAANAVYFSHDGGDSWEALATGAPEDTVWTAVRFAADRQTGFLLGVDGVPLLYKTDDGGRTWTAQTLPSGSVPSDIDLYGPQRAVVTGADGLLLTTADGGASWSQADLGSADLAAVEVVSPARAVVVGEKGLIMLTRNGGRTWKEASVPVRSSLTDIVMRTQYTGWAVGAKGVVLGTVDGGISWRRLKTPAAIGACAAVDFASQKRGWVALASGGLLGTTNGGTTWTLEQQGAGTPSPLADLDVPTPQADRVAAGLAPRSSSAASLIGRATVPPADPDADAPGRAFVVGDGGSISRYTEPGTQAPDNYVFINVVGQDAPPPAGFAFTLTDYDVPGDQPYDGYKAGVDLDPGTAADAAVFQILFRAGRSWTRDVAAWFKGRAAVAFDCRDDAAWPSGLNFAFSGQWSGVYGASATAPGPPSLNVVFAQGPKEKDDVWWLGSEDFSLVAPGPPDRIIASPQVMTAAGTPQAVWSFRKGSDADQIKMDWQLR